MSTRIIIEMDGDRYVANDLTATLNERGTLLCVENKMGYECLYSDFTKLPPVERTDNSEVIANLEDENAKLREELKDVLTVAKNRIPTIPTVFECEAIYKAQAIMKGGDE